MVMRLMSMLVVSLFTFVLFLMVAGAAGVVTLVRMPQQVWQTRR